MEMRSNLKDARYYGPERWRHELNLERHAWDGGRLCSRCGDVMMFDRGGWVWRCDPCSSIFPESMALHQK
jgi:hypothetical protein